MPTPNPTSAPAHQEEELFTRKSVILSLAEEADKEANLPTRTEPYKLKWRELAAWLREKAQ